MESFEKSLSCKINKFPTDNGLKFSYRALAEDRRSKNDKAHIFDGFCHSRNIEHRLTQFYHPQTNGMVDQMNRSIKEATVKIYFYKSVTELEEHLKYWLIYYNYEKRLKSLRVMNPYDKFLKEYETNSDKFWTNPNDKLKELSTTIYPQIFCYYLLVLATLKIHFHSSVFELLIITSSFFHPKPPDIILEA